MDYMIMKTDMSYEQFRKKFKKILKKGRKDNSGISYYGYLKDKDFSLYCSLPNWKCCGNGVFGKVIEDEEGCIIDYKMNLPQNYHLIGVSLLGGVVILQFLLQVCNIFWALVIGTGLTDFDMNRIYFFTSLSVQFLEGLLTIFAAMIINTKKEGEICIKRLEEIVEK